MEADHYILSNYDNVELTETKEELTVRTLNCHYCKKRISITTVPDFIAFCDIDCAENWKKENPQGVIET